MGSMFSTGHQPSQSLRHHAEKVLVVGLFYAGAAAAAAAGAASRVTLADDVVMAAAGGIVSAVIGILVVFLVRRLVGEPEYRSVSEETVEPVSDFGFAARRPEPIAAPSGQD